MSITKDAQPGAIGSWGARDFRPRHPVFDLIAAGLVVALLGAGAWANYWADDRRDAYDLVELGRCVYSGGRMYVDCWDNAPPGLAWINALGFVVSGGTQTGVWVLPAVAGLLCIFVLWFAVSTTLGPTAGRRIAVLSALVTSLRCYDGSSISAEFYASMFGLAAGAVWMVGISADPLPRRIGLGFVAGGLWAAATCFHPAGCAGLLAVSGVTFALAFAPAHRGKWLGVAAAVWTGFALGLVAAVGMLSRLQTVDPAWEAVVTSNAEPLAWSVLRAVASSLPRLRLDLAILLLPLWLAAFGVVVTFLVGRARKVSPAVAVVVVVWWVMSAVLVLSGPDGGTRPWQTSFPPTLILAAIGLFHHEEIFRQLDKGYRGAFLVLSMTVVSLLARPMFQSCRHGIADSYAVYNLNSNERVRLEEAGRQLAELIPEGERMFVLARDPGLYVHAGRRPASRFTYPRSERHMQEILFELAGGKAYGILMPDTFTAEFARYCGDECRRKLDETLASFTQPRTIESYRVFLRTPAPAEPPR